MLTQLRERIRLKHYSLRTEQSYVHCARRFIFFHGKRHPAYMGAPEVEAFLTWLAVECKVAASTQNQARSALLRLHQEVLQCKLPWLDQMVTARAPRRLPVAALNELIWRLSRFFVSPQYSRPSPQRRMDRLGRECRAPRSARSPAARSAS